MNPPEDLPLECKYCKSPDMKKFPWICFYAFEWKRQVYCNGCNKFYTFKIDLASKEWEYLLEDIYWADFKKGLKLH